MTAAAINPPLADPYHGRKALLFWACFVALVATAFAFVIRGFIIGELQEQFLLTETQKGEIMGAGFWPFGISIVLFSLIVDRIGYGKSMIFAFGFHVASVLMFFLAKGYWGLWAGSVLAGLAAGTVEAIVNPIVATMYPKNKTKMLTILHGGWAGGMVLGGALTLSMGDASWQMKAGLLLLPTALYGVMMLLSKFPINERVAAGVPYKDMLKECGVLGALIVAFMIIWQLGTLGQKWFGWTDGVRNISVASSLAAVLLCMGIYTRSFGRWMYSFLLLIMILLAITEIGTDGWMKELRDPGMKDLGIDGGWILVYTASIMVVMRFCIGPFVKVLKPLGVLLMGSLFAAVGLYTLAAVSVPMWILITATVYGIGQAFFWPVTIGLVAERFPRGGALTLNAIAGVGMLGVGIIGFPLMGQLQDARAVAKLKETPALAAKYVDAEPKASVFGSYTARNETAVNRLNGAKDLYDIRQAALAELGDDATPAALTEALAANKDYIAKARWTYDMVLRAPGDKTKLSDEDVLAALTAAGILVDQAGFEASIEAEHAAIHEVKMDSTRFAMQWIALLPIIMAVCYLGLIIYFRAKGGYRAVDLAADGHKIGEHKVTTTEFLADEAKGPAEGG
ncbi:MAG: MFS transporter [Planctomycetota bacterium]|jgi:MFS family permease